MHTLITILVVALVASLIANAVLFYRRYRDRPAAAAEVVEDVHRELSTPPPKPDKAPSAQDAAARLRGGRPLSIVVIAGLLMLPTTVHAQQGWRPRAWPCVTTEGSEVVCLTPTDAVRMAIRLDQVDTASAALGALDGKLPPEERESISLPLLVVSLVACFVVGGVTGFAIAR